MATYYVDGKTGNDSNGNGSANDPWKTIGKAVSKVAPGDEVRIRTAVYKEEININVRNTVWKPDTGHKPVIDGGYHDGLFSPNGTLPHPENGGGFLPKMGSMILLKEEGITVDGLTVQNCAGVGFHISYSNCVIKNCRIDFTYDQAIRVNPGASYADNLVVENNVCTRTSMKYYDPLRFGAGPAKVNAVIRLVNTRDSVVRNNICAYGHGEGIGIGKGNLRIIVEGNVVHTCAHVHIYIGRAVDSIIRNNLVYHLHHEEHLQEDGNLPSGIAIGDESSSDTWPHSAGGQFYNNIVVGLGRLFDVRNNAHNYDTQLLNCYIGYNTFIGGKYTSIAIKITGNMHGRPHKNSLFENNVIYNAPVISSTTGSISGVAFRNNLWGELPVAAMRGPGDRIGNPNLVNPLVALTGTFPEPNTSMDPINYQLTSKSALSIALASAGNAINGITPPVINKDFFGANRDSKPDIGAHEFNGAITNLSANFSIGPGQDTGPLPHTVDFTDKSTSSEPIVSHEWDFGDGGSSTEVNPSHTYQSDGTFDVALTVTDAKGNTDTHTQAGLISVTVVPNAPIPDTFRRFIIVKSADQQVVAYGTQYPDMRCMLVWNSDPFHILNFADIVEVEENVVEEDVTGLEWIDPSDQDLPPLEEDELPAGVLQSSVRVR